MHNVWSEVALTEGVGSTVILNFCATPVHPFANGVTVTVAVTATVVVFSATKDAMLPDPDVASPILPLLLPHVYVVPLTVPLKLTAVVFALLHTV